jgi:hypothetical protein
MNEHPYRFTNPLPDTPVAPQELNDSDLEPVTAGKPWGWAWGSPGWGWGAPGWGAPVAGWAWRSGGWGLRWPLGPRMW